MDKKRCIKCGHEWNPRYLDPVACPKWKTYDWNKDKKEGESNDN